MKQFIFFVLTVFLISTTCQAKDNEVIARFTFGEVKTPGGWINIESSMHYTDKISYGLIPSGKMTTNDPESGTGFVSSKKPFYFEVNLPEGHYTIELTLGGAPNGSSTTLKAESRRLMLENVKTDKGNTVKKTIVVDVHTPRINFEENIKLKERELKYLNWDNKLTLEFNGENPCVSAIEIKKATELPTIFLAGNSTVTDQENEPWASWGQMFPCFLKSNVVVANFAESGETLLAFKREKRLQKILNLMKRGDYLFIEFAHNDQKPGGNHLDPFTTYKTEIKNYITAVQKKGGKVILVTSMNRRRFDGNGKIINTLGDYSEAMRQTSAEVKVPVIDLNAMSREFYEAMGTEGSKRAFVHYPANTYPGQEKALADNTHFNPYGAYELARCIVTSIIQQKLDVSKFLIDPITLFNPKHPDEFNKFHWYESPSVNVLKPDGN